MNTLPILRLELQGMKHVISAALSNEMADLDEYLQEAISAYVTDDNLRRVISETVRKEVDKAVQEAIEHWFRYTPEGQSFINKAVSKRLNEEAGRLLGL